MNFGVVAAAVVNLCNLLQSSENKDERIQIHRFIKSSFTNLDSNGVEKDGKKYIRVTYLVRKGQRLV